MINYIKAQFVTKGLIWWTWVWAFVTYQVAHGAINIYRSTYDGLGWASAGIGDIMFALLFLVFILMIETNKKQRALFADVFKGWDATLEDNKKLIGICKELEKEKALLQSQVNKLELEKRDEKRS